MRCRMARVNLGRSEAFIFGIQRKVFMKENAVEVRLPVLHNLSNAVEDFLEIKKLIKEAAAKDSSKDVRKVSSDIMARWQKE